MSQGDQNHTRIMKNKVLRGIILLIAVVICFIEIWYMRGNTRKRKKEYLENIMEETLYASDHHTQDLNGYTELLSQYTELQDGCDVDLEYDFKCKEYEELLSTYNIKKIAGDGSEFECAVRLLDYFAPRLTHKSNYDNHIEDNSLALLEYSLNNKNHGINCKAKAKILNEMCLALGIYARRVWLMPYSSVDQDCHSVSEIYDSTYQKWIMLDMTTDCYFVNKEGTPLSVLEIRACGANEELCTAMNSSFHGNVEDAERDLNMKNTKTYFMKNMFYIEVQKYNGFGNKKTRKSYNVVPTGYDVYQRDIAYSKGQLQNAVKEKADQKEIDSLINRVKYREKSKSNYVIITPEVMKKKPE